MSQYRVNLETFAGPLDLLLYLVRKDEVDIYDIEISRIAGEYLKYIEMLKLFDIELAGDFLVMAATLMEIKSAMLLPRVEAETEAETEAIDPRKELVRQLLEYKKFKDAANLLENSAEKRSGRFTRPDVIISRIKPQQEPELDLEEVSIWTLLEAFDTMMQATGRYQSYEHITDDTPIDLYQIEVLHRLQTEGPMTFQEVFRGKSNRLQMIGVFLAMLELMKSELIWTEQAECRGEIRIRPLTSQPAEKAVQDAIYRNQEEETLRQQHAITDENRDNKGQELKKKAAVKEKKTENPKKVISSFCEFTSQDDDKHSFGDKQGHESGVFEGDHDSGNPAQILPIPIVELQTGNNLPDIPVNEEKAVNES